eukprot:TRINITY_DN342_c0_g1_i2.p1 TRINITY_DN342_c0_g1~~TRINITY_DN342_c0_g1_i2.p1  ORF type:complete len:125 (-),score=40.94 TRINITY_DN342_c0_g1_i2:139-513(-)
MTISIQHFPDAFRSCGPCPGSELMDQLSQQADNGSGIVEFETFKSMVIDNAHLVDGIEADTLSAFSVFDRDDDGTNMAQECKHVFTAIGDVLDDEEASELIIEAEPNPKGRFQYGALVDKILRL